MMDSHFAAAPPRPNLMGPSHHRRALSDTFFDIDDILLDDFVVSELNLEGPLTPPPLLPKNGPGHGVQSSKSQAIKAHVRSLSVDAGFFDGLVFDAPVQTNRAGSHVRSCSMDRHSSATSYEVESGNDSSNSVKKAMASDRLAELSLIDPKRAKRILANRQSAARSKERKIRYTTELEKKVQTLQTEATNLSAQITLLQKDTTGLTSENKELKLKLQAMEQQAHLRDALNEALREELRWLKIAAGQTTSIDGSNRVSPSQFGSRPTNANYFDNQTSQTQQQTIHSTTNPGLGEHNRPSFQDFNKKG